MEFSQMNLSNVKENTTNQLSLKVRHLGCDVLNELIDTSTITFDDDEYWLCRIKSNYGSTIHNLKEWLYSNKNITQEEFISKHSDQKENDVTHKNFDSRTFTRPKKRFTHLSVEKYNENVYGKIFSISDLHSSRESISDTGISNNTPSDSLHEVSAPLNFDLTQPSNNYFESMVANMKDSDSFQNMSPPSLVNSICSTTFANLMESSFIKNDPVLREIRDTDFTESILLQDSEAPMLQSITESCSSINSDTPESFLKKVSRNDTFKKKTATYQKKIVNIDESLRNHELSNSYLDAGDLNETRIIPNIMNVDIDGSKNNTDNSQRQTYQETSAKTENLNSTFNVYSYTERTDTFRPTLPKQSLVQDKTIENLKRDLNCTIEDTDFNKTTYCDNDDINGKSKEICESARTLEAIRSSMLTSSTDSLDRMSSISNSSRGSSRILSMADVDAIVEMQEKSLQQVMSTPKVNSIPEKLWINNYISPISTNDNLSDSDRSSNEEYKSVRSSLSKGSLENYKKSPNTTSTLRSSETEIKCASRIASTQNNYKTKTAAVRNSYSSMDSLQIKTDGKLNKKSSSIEGIIPFSNLKFMDQKLKGSYTNLRPMNTNLPVAPPLSSLNVTNTLSKSKKASGNSNMEIPAKIVEVHPMPREKFSLSDHVFIKPMQPRSSCLPRPTGIPRPSSRIPALRGNIRSSSAMPSSGKFETKTNNQ